MRKELLFGTGALLLPCAALALAGSWFLGERQRNTAADATSQAFVAGAIQLVN